MKKVIFLAMLSALALTSCGGSSSDAEVIKLNSSTFSEKVTNMEKYNEEGFVYKGDKPAVIDFYATWCGPCKYVAPVMDYLATEYGDDVYIYKVDIDECPDVAKAFGITSIPTVIYVPMEGEIKSYTGAKSVDEYTELVESVLLP